MESLRRLFKGENGKRAAAAVIILCLISGAVYVAVMGGRTPFSSENVLAAGFTMTASEEDSLGVALNTHFLIKSDVQLKTADVKGLLEAEPDIKFTVQGKGGGKEFEITPMETLEANKVYRFRLGEGAWAFQTKDEFRVLGSLPRDKGYDVPVNTGIEITFSHDFHGDIDKYFEITPEAEGSFETHKKTVVFVPKELKPGTIYTVNLKKGLGPSGSNEALKEDYTFQFETQSPRATEAEKPSAEIFFFKNLYEYPVGESPVFEFGYYTSESRDEDLFMEVNIYKYKNTDAFVEDLEEYYRVPQWAYYSKRVHRADVSRLKKHFSFRAAVQKAGYNHYILFPEGLEEGHYLADITCINGAEDETAVNQVWIQVTDITGYVSVSMDKTLVWVNDIAVGPAKDISIKIIGTGVAGKTGTDGVLIFDTPDYMKTVSDTEETYMFLELSPKGKIPCIVPMTRAWYDYYYWERTVLDYWSYIKLDRELYRPADTVNFWGVIRPMNGDAPAGEIEAVLQKFDYYNYAGGGVVDIISLSIEAEKDGTFTGELTLPDLSPGHYRLLFKIDGNEAVDRSLQVATYVKPAYRIDLATDKRAVFSGKDKITVNVTASFFEGTPVSSMQLSYNAEKGPGTVITDEDGVATVTLAPEYKEDCWYSGQGQYFSIHNMLPEAGDIYNGIDYLVFHNDMELNVSVEETAAGAEVTTQLNWVTLDRINSKDRDEASYYNSDLYIGNPVPGNVISGNVYENRWRKEEIGKYYDFINKEVKTDYYYEIDYIPVTDFIIMTDAEGKGNFIFPCERAKSYKIELETIDGMGRKVKREQYFYSGGFVDLRWQNWDYYHLTAEKEDYRFYRTGEEYKFTFKNNDKAMPEDTGNHFLYHVNQKGLKGYAVTTKASYSAPFKEQDIPNLLITGVCFDGRTYYKTSPATVLYDRKERELNVKVTADKESYGPGEEAVLDILIKDASGKPREAAVNISLVDEAMYKLMGDDWGILDGLYSKILSSGILTESYSHFCTDVTGKGGAEGGEGGGERSDFRDTAFFGVLKTDRQGKGRLTIKLPDDLTTWRATYNAVTDDLWAGSGSIPIAVKQPFFADMIINDSYLKGDKPYIALRSFGDALKKGDTVKFFVSAPSLFEEEKMLEAKAFERVFIEMPSLSSGRHPVTVRAVCGEELTDILTRDIMVHESYLVKGVTGHYALEKGLKMKGAQRGITELIFTDAGRGAYSEPLYQLYYNYGKRLDQRLAKERAYELLKEYYDADLQEPDGFEAEFFQAPDGGITLLPYSESDTALSAKAAALGAEGFDKGALEYYFHRQLFETDGDEEEISSALWGLAALDVPVLRDVKSMLKTEELGVKAKLQLGLALWELGDGSFASEILKEVLKGYGKSKEPYMTVDSGIDRDDVLEITSLAAVLAIRTGHPGAGSMFKYLADNRTKDILILLENVMYISEALPKTDGEPSEFSYRLRGKTVKEKLESGQACRLLLTPEEMIGMEILEVKGDVSLCSIYEEAFTPEASAGSDDLSVERRYYVKDKPVEEFNAEDIVKVVIECGFGDKSLQGRYQVSDFLPSGLKIIAAPYTRGLEYLGIYYPYEINGQKVSFYMYNDDRAHWDKVTYYARAVSKGDFRSQGAILQNMEADGELKITGEETIRIK